MSCRAGLLLLAACGSQAAHTPLYQAGTDKDDGAGILARASVQLTTDEETPGIGSDRRVLHAYGGDSYGEYGGMFGGDAYGGASYGTWMVPRADYVTPARQTAYTPTTGLSGSIEGVVTWGGAAPSKLASACGAIDNPTLRVGAKNALRGVLVFIDKVAVGRVLPPRPANIGGTVVKRGCALTPAAQIVTMLPSSLSIHGDATRARVRVTAGTASKAYDLQEAGLVQTSLKAGVTRIDSEDGALSAAWLVSVESPYYALTDDNGRFRIDELGPGTYDVTFWQPPVTSAKDGVLTFGSPIVVHRSVRVDAAKSTRISITLE